MKCLAQNLMKQPNGTIFFINRPFVDKNGLSNRSTSKLLLTSIFKLEYIAKIPPKIKSSKDG
jgi:hypothetical protein